MGARRYSPVRQADESIFDANSEAVSHGPNAAARVAVELLDFDDAMKMLLIALIDVRKISRNYMTPPKRLSTRELLFVPHFNVTIYLNYHFFPSNISFNAPIREDPDLACYDDWGGGGENI